MAVYKCKMCGANLEVKEGMTICECGYCGSSQTIPQVVFEKKDKKEKKKEKIFATKFLRDEAQIKQDWLCLLMKDENAPLDVTYKANLLKIQKEYYPIAVFNISCEAEWDATSFWEHEEKEQIPREETVYVDYKGQEHRSNGSDREVLSGARVISHYRKPMSRIVYDTRTKIVVDGVQQTKGHVGPKTFMERVFTGNSPYGREILKWQEHFKSSQIQEVNADFYKNYAILQETVSRASAELEAVKLEKSDIRRAVEKRVPGDRFEDLHIDNHVIDIERNTVYVGVYHIFYEYEGKNYTCLMGGGDRVDDIVLGEHPIDNTIKNNSDVYKEGIKNNGIGRTLFLIGAICLTLINIIAVPAVMGFSMFIGMFNGFGIIVGILILLLLVGSNIFCIVKCVIMHNRKKQLELEKTNFDISNANIKKQIYDLIQNDTISEEQKRITIKGWINQQFGFYESIKEGHSKENKNRKTIAILVAALSGCGVVVLLLIATLFFIVIPSTKYKAAMELLDNNQLVEGVEILKEIPYYKDSSRYIKQYSSPVASISDTAYLRGIELIEYFDSEEFEEKFGQAAKDALEKEYGNNWDNITIKEYADVFVSTDIFNDYVNKIDEIQSEEEDDSDYLEAVKGFYYLACDHAIAKSIEENDTTYYYSFEQRGNWAQNKNMDALKKVFYDDNSSLTLSMLDRIEEYGMLTIIGAAYEPDSNLQVDKLKYFDSYDEPEEYMSDNSQYGTTDTNAGNSEKAEWFDLTDLTGDVPSFYGIWCAGSESKMEAINIAKVMASEGISSAVFYSESWSNLAGNSMYVVTAGTFVSESDAYTVLPYVLDYFPDAFVGYSGQFIEYPESATNYNDDDSNNDNYYIEYLISQALTKELTDEDLQGYTSFELSAARNGIYAAYGYVFQSSQWNSFFSGFSWYIPNPDFRQEDIGELERKNAETIRAYEEKTYGGVYAE